MSTNHDKVAAGKKERGEGLRRREAAEKSTTDFKENQPEIGKGKGVEGQGLISPHAPPTFKIRNKFCPSTKSWRIKTRFVPCAIARSSTEWGQQPLSYQDKRNSGSI